MAGERGKRGERVPRLIIYPHGLGDIIMLTPALRALTGEMPHVAILERFAGTGILDHCPHIGGCHHKLPDPWNSSGGRRGCRQAGEKLARFLGLEPVWIWHRSGHHKIKENMHFLNVASTDYQTEVYLDPADRQWTHSGGRYGFLHCKTGMPGLSTAAAKKDFDSDAGRRWLLGNGCERVEEVGVEVATDLPMSVQFAIMNSAEKVCLADSVFYHACHAMGKRVDFAYFGRGMRVHAEVRPLHTDNEMVSVTPPELEP